MIYTLSIIIYILVMDEGVEEILKGKNITVEQLERYLNSKLFKKWRAYRGLGQGIEQLKENDLIFNQLVQGILRRVSRVKSEETVKEILDAFVEEVESHTELLGEKEEVETVSFKNDVEEVDAQDPYEA